MSRKVLKRLVLFFVLAALPTVTFVSCVPVVETVPVINAERAALAKSKVGDIIRQFTGDQGSIEIRLSHADVDAMAAVASHTVPRARFLANTSDMGTALSATLLLSESLGAYLNVSCFLLPDAHGYGFSHCLVGRLPLSGGLVELILRSTIIMVFDREVADTVGQLISQAVFDSGELVIAAHKPNDFKARLKSKLSPLMRATRAVIRNESLEEESLQAYLNYLSSVGYQGDSLLPYMRLIFAEAQRRSSDGDVLEENTAALWALSIYFGNTTFRRLTGLYDLEIKKSPVPVELKGRRDLALHFIYSIVLDQVGRSDFGLSVGETKELLDSNSGNSGFSFADLAADKAGLKLSTVATQSSATARRVQRMLSVAEYESVFFPFIHDLPEGISSEDFIEYFGDINTPQYKAMEDLIDDRISGLTLYSKAVGQQLVEPELQRIRNGEWLKIDTHVHSNYSDGSHSIAEVASRANSFGCDVIAVTDHGDHELRSLFSEEYFKEIDAAAADAGITVIPGLEWNVPPFNGREHLTVLLPFTDLLPSKLRMFRERFDHLGPDVLPRLDPANALQWLNRSAVTSEVGPVLFYNHPSRKALQPAENIFDFKTWRSESASILGFSGAPGHQRSEGKGNGSYKHHLRTVNRWDPSIAHTGGEWDQLLREGINAWGARAPSDFHNLDLDYWPCEFSTTHLYSVSADHNDVLKALHSGYFWAQHGRFVNAVDFKISSVGGRDIASMGETLQSHAGATIKVSIMIVLAPSDWERHRVHLDQLEMIVNTPEETVTLVLEPDASSKAGIVSYSEQLPLDGAYMSVRLRGKHKSRGGDPLYFYTNPIRVISR